MEGYRQRFDQVRRRSMWLIGRRSPYEGQDATIRNPSGLALDGLGSMSGPCDARLVEQLAAIFGDWIRVLRNIEFEFDSAELLP